MKLSTSGKFWISENTTANLFCNPGHCDATNNFLHFCIKTYQAEQWNSKPWRFEQLHWAFRWLQRVLQYTSLSRLCFSLTVEISVVQEKIARKGCRTQNFPVLVWNCELFKANKLTNLPTFCWKDKTDFFHSAFFIIDVTHILNMFTYLRICIYVCMSILNLRTKKPPWLSVFLSEKDGRGITHRTTAITHCTLLNTLLECTDKSTAKKLNR